MIMSVEMLGRQETNSTATSHSKMGHITNWHACRNLLKVCLMQQQLFDWFAKQRIWQSHCPAGRDDHECIVWQTG